MLNCPYPLTIKHILIECADSTHFCNKYFVTSSVDQLFEEIVMQNVIEFIKDIHIY